MGLPKTGTSTLAVMLRMLDYRVTGPNIDYSKGDSALLHSLFQDYNGFQDYPWCFEWQKFLDHSEVKFIILKREKESWYKSFYESYGGKEDRYLSYPFFGITKTPENKSEFLSYFDSYYASINEYQKKNPERFLEVSVKSIEWNQMCQFLNEELPKNIFGKVLQIPHVNKQKAKTSKTFKYKVLDFFKRKISWVIGEDNWVKLVIFLRKNNIV